MLTEINKNTKIFARESVSLKQHRQRSVLMLKSLNPVAYKVYIVCCLFGLFVSVCVMVDVYNTDKPKNIFLGVILLWLMLSMAIELIIMMVFHFLLPWLTTKVTLCEPRMLIVDSDFLLMKFFVYEQVSRRPLPRKGYSIELDDDVEYTFFINKSSLRSLSIDKEVCKINGTSLIYLPKFIYTGEKTNYNNFDKDYHIKMHDIFINDDDCVNRDETYPWIIKRDEFSFIFMFDDDAKQTLLEWSKK